MALFRSTKEKSVEEVVSQPKPKASVGRRKVAATSPSKSAGAKGEHAGVLRSPRITEKATGAQERGVYVFNVSPRATKRDISRAVREIYGVVPRRVNLATVRAKLIYTGRRRKPGKKAGGKKAYVYLRTGETISIL